MSKKLPDCYEEDYCQRAKTVSCKKCERNFDNFDIADNYLYKDSSVANESTSDSGKLTSPRRNSNDT